MSDATDFLVTTPGKVAPEFDPTPTEVNTPVLGEIVLSVNAEYQAEGTPIYSFVPCNGSLVDPNTHPKLAEFLGAVPKDMAVPAERQAIHVAYAGVAFTEAWSNPEYTEQEGYDARYKDSYLTDPSDFYVWRVNGDHAVTEYTPTLLTPDAFPLLMTARSSSNNSTETSRAELRFYSGSTVVLLVFVYQNAYREQNVYYSLDNGVTNVFVAKAGTSAEMGALMEYLPDLTGIRFLPYLTYTGTADVLVDLATVTHLTIATTIAHRASPSPGRYTMIALETVGRYSTTPEYPSPAPGVNYFFLGDKQ